MSDACKWLHEQFERAPLVRYPFDLSELPKNGIYAFYEDGETWGHSEQRPRIVRIGTHKQGNFRSRIREHYLLDERKMRFDASKPAPHERSIFRKNIGRALLNRDHDPYLDIWEIDYTTSAARRERGYLRDIAKERALEAEITSILRTTFSFRYLVVEDQAKRVGANGLESALIGTVAGCRECEPSSHWLGLYSPVAKIRASGMWLYQHVDATGIVEQHREGILSALADTQVWLQTAH